MNRIKSEFYLFIPCIHREQEIVMEHNDSLERISNEVRGCPLCGLSRTRKNAVAGEGKQSARIMFVGEAPGRNEDIKGRPFVGAAGKILDAALDKAGINRSEVFITNIVKCRPPENRIPKDDEVHACKPYLERQIAIIQPKVICVLGRTAFSSLLGGDSITASRGKLVSSKGRKYFLTIHPAAAIYNKKFLSVLEADIKALAKISNAGSNSKKHHSLEEYV